jgi:predicted RNA-binding protein with TRAM domain
VDHVEEALNAMHYELDDDEKVNDALQIDGDMFSDLTVDDLFDSDDDDEEEDDDEEAEEYVEDISHLVTLQDGKYTFLDPESGEVIDLGDDSDDEIVVDDEEDDFFAGLTPSQRLERLGEIMDDSDGESQQSTTTIEIGDSIDVYIQAVSKQSGRFMVTTRSTGPSMKVLKQETKSNKNLERLLIHFDGDINKILSLVGDEGEGIVKAISKTGDWLYVQPQFRGLPVGVAQLASGITLESLSEGDSVRIRVDRVDEARGQLALTVVENR